VQEKVTGITGTSCADVTAKIEAALGRVITQEKTSEFFAQRLESENLATTQTTFSDW
jgi:Protein of unknown function (DUF2997)